LASVRRFFSFSHGKRRVIGLKSEEDNDDEATAALREVGDVVGEVNEGTRFCDLGDSAGVKLLMELTKRNKIAVWSFEGLIFHQYDGFYL
jgi:hypothetical protein